MSELHRRSVTRKAAPITLQERSDGALPLIRGYAAVFFRAGEAGTEFQLWPGVKERIMPGAFDRAIAADGGDDVRALFDHDSARILGRRSAGTLRLGTDARGLWYEIDPPQTTAARDLIESIRRGDVTGSSFAFLPRGTTRREDGNELILERVDVQLFDVGPVTFPAYPGTDAGLRSARSEVDAYRAYRRDMAAADAALVDVLLAGDDIC